jgi:hypothetical protein
LLKIIYHYPYSLINTTRKDGEVGVSSTIRSDAAVRWEVFRRLRRWR